MEFRCDKGCGKMFTNRKLLKRPMGDGITKYILKCTHCGQEYRVFYEDTELRKLRRQLRNPLLDPDLRTKTREKVKQLQAALVARFENSGPNS